ncbi:SWIM zinc finger family protein [Rossellomorea marisflavi]|uniref:SWIM zinc finger family protein n=1 Tax=Rossellomorea marisflavi TaxID=189381 RepID=UPI001EE34C1D|nr:SWIM zinc finger family protein [Rossellomorea marisflavi]UKS65030.1 SWIM zinc finger family protein [Rossellomorea marisflavi]
MSIRIEELKEQLYHVSESLEEVLDPKREADRNIVSKGLMLFRQNSVSQVKVRDEEVMAQVQDVTPVSVELNFTFPLISSCSCPQDVFCRHQLAVFLFLLNKTGSVSEWVGNWRSGKHDTAGGLEDLMKKHGGLKKASDLLKERKTRGNTPEEWWDYFHTLLKPDDFELLQRQPYIMDVLVQNIMKRFMKESPFEREWKPLYKLYATLYLTIHLDRFLQEKGVKAGTEQYSMYDYLLGEMEDALEKMSVHAMPFSFDPYIAFLKEKTVWLSDSTKNSTLIKAEVYRFLWYFLFKQKAWRQEEIKRISESGEDLETFGHLALLHHYLMLEEFDKADGVAKGLGSELVSFSEFWLRKFFTGRRYEAGLFLVRHLLERLPEHVGYLDQFEASRFVRWFIRIMPMDWLTEKDPLLVKELLLAMLPYSFFHYNEYLINVKEYKEWVELQRYMNYSIPEMEGMGLKDLTKEQPELALPLYFSGVMNAIEQKNRDSYRQAVRYMKKIRTIYRKLKQTDKWDQFLSYILDRFKRLRAFQEECRKGKLIDA